MTDNNHSLPVNNSAPDKQAEFVIGALVGAAVGAAAALLLTPKNGQEMRKIVRDYAQEWEGEAFELAKDAKGVTTTFRSMLNESANNLIETAPEKISQVASQAHTFSETLEQHIENAKEAMAEISEAFRSGWEEYGEDVPSLTQSNQEDSSQDVIMNHAALVDLAPSPATTTAVVEEPKVEAEAEAVPPSHSSYASSSGRRRGNQSANLSMHADLSPILNAAPEAPAEPQPQQPVEDKKPAATTIAPDSPLAKHTTSKPHHTETPTKPKEADKPAKAAAAKDKPDTTPSSKPTKKLFFRK